MRQINQVTVNALQQQTFVLEDGTSFSFTLYYSPIQQGWFFTDITYQTFTLNGMRVTNNINMLNQWRNLIPFGIGCISKANREPSLQPDFASRASTLYVLDKAECREYARLIAVG